ncbi:trypsin-like cysteine/serine peptidase domain-containing protein [Massariosphaeria phaeospora]|uniref:Trypsin-like cysteine/serine peptidase domain-containing protein n=1 Tax=Massariosphaeria phaeospora TaxID=100035 RepID=A0A7C8MMV7_9PLEO|nr:trypsin-like cysteine/serine peptidase domain-containing protein [Massariosphaeria phaeospora]
MTPVGGSSLNPIPISDSPQKETGTPSASKLENTQACCSIALLPTKLPSTLPGLNKKSIKLLQYKQQRLKSPDSQTHQLQEFCDPNSEAYGGLKNAVDATLVFAQVEAGTAVCISSEGLLLTCSHCIAESDEALDMGKVWWLLFASGRIVQARTVKWDARRDLALLQIMAAQPPLPATAHTTPTQQSPFPCVPLAPAPPPLRTPLLCIGHPGSEDLEIGRPGVETGYDVLHVSDGKFCGYAKGQDRQDNSEIGALKHDCWTYWGHSGGPLVARGRNGEGEEWGLVALHSSWDEETGMRRGVGWEAISGFLREVEG